MDKKFEDLTIKDVFVLSKVMTNLKLARRLMEKLTGDKVHHVSLESKNIIEREDGSKGVFMELHICDIAQSVQRVELYVKTEDVFKKGCAVYHFAEQCEEIPGLRLQNGVHRIFVCATPEAAEAVRDLELKALLYYILDSKDRRTNLTKMLDDEVRRIKTNFIYEKEYRRLQCEETEASQRAYAEYRQGKSKYRRYEKKKV